MWLGMKKIWIITINRNWLDDTIECVDSLLENSYANKEIIVVDNDSKNDEWIKLQKLYEWLWISFILNKENRGFAWWCNDWIKKAQELWCDYFLLFNNDAVAKNGFLEKLVTTADWDWEIWVIWPAITYYKSDELWFAWWIISEWTWIFRHKWKKNDKSTLENMKPYQTDYVTWCCMMIKKELLDEQWMLDEDYFAYYEEADYCYRARKRWWKCIVVPDAIIEHKKSASAGNEWKDTMSIVQAYLISRNLIIFWKKNLEWLRKYIYLIIAIPLNFLKNLIVWIRSFSVLKSYVKWTYEWLFSF